MKIYEVFQSGAGASGAAGTNARGWQEISATLQQPASAPHVAVSTPGTPGPGPLWNVRWVRYVSISLYFAQFDDFCEATVDISCPLHSF